MTTALESATAGDLRIAFSGEAEASSGTMLVRAVIDSKPTNPVRFTSDASGLEMSSRSFVFRAPGLNAGWHDVRMQWAVAGSGQKAWLGDRTMTVYAAPGSGTGGGLVTAGDSSKAPVTPTTKWAPCPGRAWTSDRRSQLRRRARREHGGQGGAGPTLHARASRRRA